MSFILAGIRPISNQRFYNIDGSNYSVVLGESVGLLTELLQVIRGMRFLCGPWLMFNAFIFALLK